MATRPNPIDLFDLVARLERRLSSLETSSRIGYAAIPNGARLEVLDAADDPVLRIGTLSDGGYGIERWDGTAWVTGTMGPQGDSVRRFHGSGPPGTIIGAKPGDEYLDITTGDLYYLG